MEVGGSNNFEGAMPRTILEAVMAAAVIEKRTVANIGLLSQLGMP